MVTPVIMITAAITAARHGTKTAISATMTRVDITDKLAENGIYINEVKGLHAGANAVTGDFSIESAGFLVKNGKITKAVKSFTVAGNFFELLKKIEALSDTVRFDASAGYTSYGSPDVLVREMSVAGK